MNSTHTFTLLRALALVACCVGASLALDPPRAPAAVLDNTPIPCEPRDNGRARCTFRRPGDGKAGGSIVVRGGNVVGFLRQGGNTIECQAQGATVHDERGFVNSWYAWVLSDTPGQFGWVSALDASGGGDDGKFEDARDCTAQELAPPAGEPGRPGPPPSICGLWFTSPPSDGSACPDAPGPGPSPGPGPGPVDHSRYMPGQHLNFKPGAVCTAGFVLKLKADGRLLGLSAAHCQNADLEVAVDVERLGAFAQALGSVQASGLTAQGVNALLFGPAAGLSKPLQDVERGPNDPIAIEGKATRDQQTRDPRVCFAGNQSGADVCGRRTDPVTPTTGYFCTDLASQPEDGGGPVYTQPKLKDEVLTALAVGMVLPPATRGGPMCFMEIDVLERVFDADFVTLTSGAGRRLLRAVRPVGRMSRRTGLRLRVLLTRRATIQISIRRAAHGSVPASRWRTVGRRGKKGWNRIDVKRTAAGSLGRGRYEATVTARTKGVRSTPWRLTFRIR